MSRVQSLKGFRDFLPAEALKRQWLKNQLIKVFEAWGYDPMETPTLEPLELFAGQIGEDEKLFFKFKDPGGRDVALRYDQTVPTCRVVGELNQQIPLPFKRYQIQSVFRAENPQKGRYREFTSADADIFGIQSPYADAEVIALSLDIYKKLGFPKVKVLINDRQLLKDLPYEAIVAVDKLKKIGQEGVLADMVQKGIDKKTAQNYFEKVINLQPNETVNTIQNYLKEVGFSKDWYEFEPTLARSFSYSTGPIWEVVIPGYDGGSVLGGERYDQLTREITGADIPGTGFGLGFDRTLEAADQFSLIPLLKTNSRVLITVFVPDLFQQSLEISSKLRKANINTEIYPNPKTKLDKQLKYADQKSIPYVIILGPEEVKTNKVTLKDLSSKTQVILTLEEAINKIKR